MNTLFATKMKIFVLISLIVELRMGNMFHVHIVQSLLNIRLFGVRSYIEILTTHHSHMVVRLEK